MSTTPRPALLSDEQVYDARAYPSEVVRDIYEAARAKDAELIQLLVDAIQGEVVRCGDGFCQKSTDALAAAKAAGFGPSEPVTGCE